MFKITIDDDVLLFDLKGKENRAKNTKPLMRSIAEDLDDSTEENFRVEGRPRWDRLKLATKKRRAKKGKLGRILQVDRQLKDSISTEYTDTTAIIGTNKPYARIHQKGGTISHPRGYRIKMPARPYIKLTKTEEKEIEKRIDRYFER